MKKIMFNERYGLQQGVIARTKTMTRRVDKRLNHPLVTEISDWGIDDNGKCYLTITYSTGLIEDVYPAYQIGEEVAVAQCYEDAILDVGEEEWNKRHKWYCIENLRKRKGLHNKMFVQADLMPHRIKITGIKLERLQDISEEDCLKEGVEKWIDCYIVPGIMENQGKNNVCFDTPREAFAALIDRISGKATWQRNPWVYAYEFELLR
jgi:hypothetical protein